MDQTTSDKTADLAQDLDVAHSVAIEADCEKTNDVLKQDETLVQDKQVLIIPLSTEDSSRLKSELSFLESEIKSSHANIQQITASSIPTCVISSTSSHMNYSGPPPVLRLSPPDQQNEHPKTIGNGNGHTMEVSKPGLSGLTATHAGLPRIISTRPQLTFPGQKLRMLNPGQSYMVANQGLARPRQDDESSPQGPAPKAFKQDITLSPIDGDERPRLRLAPISALFNQPSPSKVPPSMPPLLRLPTAPPVFSIPVSSSGPSKSMIHETPIQAAYANIPIATPRSESPPSSSAIVELLSNSKHYISESNSARVSTGASYSISLPDGATASYSIELPGGSKATASLPVTLPGESAEETVVLSDNSSTSGGDLSKDANNASKCREYRERSKARKEQEMKDFQHHLDKNIRLKAIYDKKTEAIRKLKLYYLECLQNKRYKCVEKTHDIYEASKRPLVTGSDSSAFSSDSPHTVVSSKPPTAVIGSGDVTNPPMVVIKTEDTTRESSSNGSETCLPMVTIKAEEAELLIANVKSEV